MIYGDDRFNPEAGEQVEVSDDRNNWKLRTFIGSLSSKRLPFLVVSEVKAANRSNYENGKNFKVANFKHMRAPQINRISDDEAIRQLERSGRIAQGRIVR